MKICGWTEEEGGLYGPGIIWEQSVEVFLNDLIAEQKFTSDIFAEIERALAGKVSREKESQRIVIFTEGSDFPPLAIHLVEEAMGQQFYIVGVGLFV